MAKPIEVTAIDISKIELFSPDLLKRSAQFLLRLQSQRLDSGVGSNGSKMPAYSERYAEFRREKGRVADRRTLTFTGAMLAGRRVTEQTKTAVRLGWVSGTSEAKKAEYNDDMYAFAAPTDAERKQVIAFAEREVKRLAKKSKESASRNKR